MFGSVECHGGEIACEKSLLRNDNESQEATGRVAVDAGGAGLVGMEIGKGDSVGGPGLQVGAGLDCVGDVGAAGVEGEAQGVGRERRDWEMRLQVGSRFRA